MISLLFCLLFPILSGLAVCVGFRFLDASRFAIRGVVPPYFTAIALLFSLFASHTSVEVWDKVRRINSLLFAEASAVRAVLRIAEPFDTGSMRVRHAVDSLLAEIRMQEAAGATAAKLGEQVPMIFPELYRIAADPGNFHGNLAANTAFYDAVERLRAAWFERSELRSSRVALEYYVILFAFGLMTQISIALSQAGSPRAQATTVMLFSLAFMGAVGIIYVLDDADRFTHVITRAAIEDVARNPAGTPSISP